MTPHPRRFRFAAQMSKPPEPTARAWADLARKVEDLGYDALLMPDHFGDQLAPVPALVAAAEATTRLRVGTLVLDNDYRHPLVVAKELATLDLLTDGRLEIGLGAGWMATDYDQSGIAHDPPGVRIDRFEEGLAVVTGLLEAEGPFSFSGRHYTVTGHTPYPRPAQRPRPPVCIGGGGRRMLGIAARHADIVSINVDLRGGTAGPEVAPDATPASTLRKVGWVREAAGDRFEEIELNALVGFVLVTDDARSVIEAMAPAFGIDPADGTHVPLVLIGTLDQIAEELEWRRREYHTSYFAIEGAGVETLAPVVARLAGT